MYRQSKVCFIYVRMFSAHDHKQLNTSLWSSLHYQQPTKTIHNSQTQQYNSHAKGTISHYYQVILSTISIIYNTGTTIAWCLFQLIAQWFPDFSWPHRHFSPYVRMLSPLPRASNTKDAFQIIRLGIFDWCAVKYCIIILWLKCAM